MARQNLPRVLAEVYKHEGGYAEHPRDPGGATNMGITHKTLAEWRGVERVSRDEVKALTKAEADEIYRARYWNVVQGDALPYGLDLAAMDGAVNSGPRQGAKWLQRGLGVAADGIVGPQTITAAQRAPVEAISRACMARMAFLQGLGTWDAFGRGWSRRVASVEAVGVRMWLAAAHGNRVAREGLSERVEAAPGLAAKERRAGGAQASATGAGGAGGVTVADLPPETATALALGVVAVAILLIIRARRRARFHEDRREAFAAEMEALP